MSKQARLLLKTVIAPHTLAFVFGTNALLDFQPGQFVSIQVGVDAQQNPILRSYSLTSGPWQAHEMVLIVSTATGGYGSQFFEQMQPGDLIHFTGPLGFFVNERTHLGDVVYAATGTGIAPIYPMVQEVLHRNETGHIHLYWGLRYPEDLFYQQQFMQLQAQHQRLHLHFYFSRAPEGQPVLRGRIIQPILQQLPTWQSPVFYLCGNGAMIQELKSLLQAQGIDRKKQIRTEAFFD